jgi:hypothetical protein
VVEERRTGDATVVDADDPCAGVTGELLGVGVPRFRPDWLARVLEIRKIGPQLNREGGIRLMTETIAQAERVSESRLIEAVIPLLGQGDLKSADDGDLPGGV